MQISKDITANVLAGVITSDVKRVEAARVLGMFRVVLVEDETYSFEDLCGDMYNPEANPDVDVTVLARQKRAYRARVNRDGVYGSLAQVRNTPTGLWVTVESIWGFVGEDFIGSGYESDFIENASEWLFTNLDLPKLQAAFKDLM